MVCICIKTKRRHANVSALLCLPLKRKSETVCLKTASILLDTFDIFLILLEASYRSISMFSLCSLRKFRLKILSAVSMSGDCCLSLPKYDIIPLHVSKFQQPPINIFFLLCLPIKEECRKYMPGDCCLSLLKSVVSLVGYQNGIWVLLCSFFSLLCLLEIKMPLRAVHETLGNTKTLCINYIFANYICTYLKNTPVRGCGCLVSVQLQNQVLASTYFSPKAIRCQSMSCSFFCSKSSRCMSMTAVSSGGGVEWRQQKLPSSKGHVCLSVQVHDFQYILLYVC